MFKKCRCRRFDSCKSEKSSLRVDLERAIIYLRKQRKGSSSHRNGFTFGPTQFCRYHRPTHLQLRPNQLLKRERDKRDLFEGIMIDHEQLNPLVRSRVHKNYSWLDGEAWLSFPRIVSEKQRFFIQRVNFAFFFFFDLHRDMQVIPDSEASIVLLLFKKKITRWCSWRLKCPEKK